MQNTMILEGFDIALDSAYPPFYCCACMQESKRTKRSISQSCVTQIQYVIITDMSGKFNIYAITTNSPSKGSPS